MVAQIVYGRVISREVELGQREKLILVEIAGDSIDTASSFVDYISEVYGISKSSVWYNLNCLKEKGVLEFADKKHIGEPLRLTRAGQQMLVAMGQERRSIEEMFTSRAEVGYASVGFGRRMNAAPLV